MRLSVRDTEWDESSVTGLEVEESPADCELTLVDD